MKRTTATRTLDTSARVKLVTGMAWRATVGSLKDAGVQRLHAQQHRLPHGRGSVTRRDPREYDPRKYDRGMARATWNEPGSRIGTPESRARDRRSDAPGDRAIAC